MSPAGGVVCAGMVGRGVDGDGVALGCGVAGAVAVSVALGRGAVAVVLGTSRVAPVG